MVYSGIFGQGTGISLEITASCAGNEISFLQCSSQNYGYDGLHSYACYNYMNNVGVKCESGMRRHNSFLCESEH